MEQIVNDRMVKDEVFEPRTLAKKHDRIVIIDILRGFTLLGIILVHISNQYVAGGMPEAVRQSSTMLDNILEGVVNILISGKFFAIFSFLFGLSFYIQLSHNQENKKFILRFAWRLVLLFAIGFIHHLHYKGDILSIYAILGAILIIFRNVSDKWLLITALILSFNLPLHFYRLGEGILEALAIIPAQGNPFDGMGGGNDDELYYNTVKSGAYPDILVANAKHFITKMNFQVISGRLYITAGLFLLGLYIGRKKFFENLSENMTLVRKMFKWSGLFTLGAYLFGILLAVIFMGLLQIPPITVKIEQLPPIIIEMRQQPPPIMLWIVTILYDASNNALALFYVTAIIILHQKVRWQRILSVFYEAGRMGLTTYLGQSIFAFFFFFSLGFRQLGEHGTAFNLGVAVLFFAFQIGFSKWWLSKFKYGIFEWLWRCGTDLKWHTLIKSK